MGVVSLVKICQHCILTLLFVFSPLVWADTPPGEIDANKARMHYMLNCQGCHLHDGAGSRDGEVPEMKDYVGNFLRVPNGREFLVQVPGSANAPLSDSELANLLNWILVTIGGESTPSDFTPYNEHEVGTLRTESLTDVVTLRAALVQQISLISE
jgi:hypothetical protein